MINKHDFSLICCYVIGDINDGVGTVVGFRGDETIINYESGYSLYPTSKIRIVERHVCYKDPNTGKVLYTEI